MPDKTKHHTFYTKQKTLPENIAKALIEFLEKLSCVIEHRPLRLS